MHGFHTIAMFYNVYVQYIANVFSIGYNNRFNQSRLNKHRTIIPRKGNPHCVQAVFINRLLTVA